MVLDTLDISFNRFTQQGLIKFLKKLTDLQSLTMRSFSSVGNSLKIQETVLLDETLDKVIRIPGL